MLAELGSMNLVEKDAIQVLSVMKKPRRLSWADSKGLEPVESFRVALNRHRPRCRRHWQGASGPCRAPIGLALPSRFRMARS